MSNTHSIMVNQSTVKQSSTAMNSFNFNIITLQPFLMVQFGQFLLEPLACGIERIPDGVKLQHASKERERERERESEELVNHPNRITGAAYLSNMVMLLQFKLLHLSPQPRNSYSRKNYYISRQDIAIGLHTTHLAAKQLKFVILNSELNHARAHLCWNCARRFL